MTATTQGMRLAQPSVAPAPADRVEGRASAHLMRRMLLLAGAVIGGWFLICALQTTHAAAATGRPAPSAPIAAVGNTLTKTVTDAVTPAVTTVHKAAATGSDTARRAVTQVHAVVRRSVTKLRSVRPATLVYRIVQRVTVSQPVKITQPVRSDARHLLHPTKIGSVGSSTNRSAHPDAHPARARTVSGVASQPVATAAASSSPRTSSLSRVPVALHAAAVHQLIHPSCAPTETPTPGGPAPQPAPMPAPVGAVVSAGSERGLSLATIAASAPHSTDVRTVRLAAAASADLPTIADEPSFSPD